MESVIHGSPIFFVFRTFPRLPVPVWLYPNLYPNSGFTQFDPIVSKVRIMYSMVSILYHIVHNCSK